MVHDLQRQSLQAQTLCVLLPIGHLQCLFAPRKLLAKEHSFLCRYVTETDLAFFQERIEEEAVLPGVGEWQHMTDMKLDSLTYTAWRRRLSVRHPFCDALK